MLEELENIIVKDLRKSLENIGTVMLESDLESKKVEGNTLDLSDSFVVGQIDISGYLNRGSSRQDFIGEVGIHFSERVYLKVASKVLMDDFSEINDENDDVAGEIANMVIGRAKNDLLQKGIHFGMESPRTLINRKNKKTQDLELDNHVALFELKCDLGVFHMKVLFNRK